jgi:membrane-associated phospholipid phosphatase
VATIYFGWHYVVDDVAGVAIGAVAVWGGALATGHDLPAAVRRQLARPAHSAARLT